MAEVYAWNEGKIYFFPTGGPSAVLAFAESLTLSVDHSWQKFKNLVTGSTGMEARTHFVYADKSVSLSVGMLHANQSAFQMVNSATAFNATVVLAVTGGLYHTHEYKLNSAVFSNFTVEGQDGALFRASVTMEAADISGI